MYCPKCGSELSNNSKFCSKCGTAVTSTNVRGAIIKPSKRKNVFPIILGFIVCVLFVVVCYTKVKSGSVKENNIGNSHENNTGNDIESNILYLSNGEYEFSSSPDAEQSVVLGASLGYPFSSYEYGRDNLVKFSSDGKYIYFYTDVQDYENAGWHKGNLLRAECSNLINSPKNEPQITEVAHDIIISDWDSNEYLSFLDNGMIIYQTCNNSLYAFDGSKTIEIAENITGYFTDNSEHLIYEVKDGENIYGGTYSVYGVFLDHLEESVQLATQVDMCLPFITQSGDIYYQKFYTDDYESIKLSDLYTVGFDQETQKVFSNCYWVDFNENYCLVQNGNSISLYDCVQDTDSDTSNMEQLREELKSRRLDLYTAYYMDNEKTEKIADDILSPDEVFFNASSETCGNLAYVTAEQATRNKPISIDIFLKFEDVATDPLIFAGEDICLISGCIYDPQQHRTYQLSEDAKDVYKDVSTGYEKVAFCKDAVYLSVPGTLADSPFDVYIAKIDEDGVVGKFSKIIDNALNPMIFENEDPDTESIYYVQVAKETDDFVYFNLNFYNHGTDISLAQNILAGSLCSDGSILAYTDYDDTYGYELTRISPEGEPITIAQHVTDFAPTDSDTILYISDHDLYCYDSTSKLVKSNVDYFWVSNASNTEDSFQSLF